MGCCSAFLVYILRCTSLHVASACETLVLLVTQHICERVWLCVVGMSTLERNQLKRKREEYDAEEADEEDDDEDDEED